MIVLDTNVVSALMARSMDIDPWLSTVSGRDFFMTVMTRAEIRYGLARLPPGRKREDLSARANAFFLDVEDRLLFFDAEAADRYGALVATRTRKGSPISVPDAIIASIVWTHRATLATRNTCDFEDCDIPLVNPYAV